MELIAAFVPIWTLTTVGYLARRLGLLGGSAASVLGWFVFHLGIPAALFLTLARTPLSGFDARPLLAFAASTALVICAGCYGAGRIFGRKPAEQAIWGMAGGYVNSANLGIPVAMQVLGSVSFLVQVVLLQVLVVAPIILTTLDRHADAAGRIRIRRIVTLPVRNPVILASALGVLCSATSLQAPSALRASLTLLSSAAVPAALVALGASLYQEKSPASEEPPTRTERTELAAIAALKLAAQPMIAFVIGAYLLHLPHPELLAVVVCAGLPTAQNAFIFAQQYSIGEALASRAVLITTTLSLASIMAAVMLLGR